MKSSKSICDKVRDKDELTLSPIRPPKNSTKDKAEKSKASSDKTFKTPKKFSAQLKTRRTNSNDTNSSKYTDQETDSGDDDIIKSSQETNESWLRKKIKNLSSKSNTLKTTPQKINNTVSPGSVERQHSIGDACEVSSSIIKEELNEMYDNIDENNSFEMTHDLSDVITDDQPPSLKVLMSPTNILFEQITIDENVSVDINEEEEYSKNPLHSDEEHIAKNNKTMHVTERKTRNKSLSSVKNVNYQNGKSHLNLSIYELEYLKDLQIQLQHEVPLQHTIEPSGGTRALTEKQIQEFESCGPLKKGPYSDSEDKILRQNWEHFCEIHDWDKDIVEPFLYFKHDSQYIIASKQERTNFLRFLANGLPWRSLFSVYCRFRNLYSNLLNGPYSKKEDKIIMDHLLELDNDSLADEISNLSRLLRRNRHSVWQRFQKIKKMFNTSEETCVGSESNYSEDDNCKKTKNLKRKHSESSVTDLSGSENEKNTQIKNNKKMLSLRKNIINNDKQPAHKEKSIECKKKVIQQKTEVKWTNPLVNKFVNTLMEVTSTENILDLKDVEIIKYVWRIMENEMSIDRDCLCNFWYSQLHMQIFCPGPLHLKSLKMNLIEFMYGEELTSVEDIKSDIVFSRFKGVTTCFLSTLIDYLLKFASSKTHTSDFRTNVKYLFKSYLPQLKAQRIDKILPKLYFKNGKIVHVDVGSYKRIPNPLTMDPLSDDE